MSPTPHFFHTGQNWCATLENWRSCECILEDVLKRFVMCLGCMLEFVFEKNLRRLGQKVTWYSAQSLLSQDPEELEVLLKERINKFSWLNKTVNVCLYVSCFLLCKKTTSKIYLIVCVICASFCIQLFLYLCIICGFYDVQFTTDCGGRMLILPFCC